MEDNNLMSSQGIHFSFTYSLWTFVKTSLPPNVQTFQNFMPLHHDGISVISLEFFFQEISTANKSYDTTNFVACLVLSTISKMIPMFEILKVVFIPVNLLSLG